MSNTLSVIDMVAREALRIAHEKATFIGTINRSYDDSFGKAGAKVGSTLRVRNPNRYTRTKNTRVMDVQDTTESTQTITLATQDHVDIRFNSAELSLSIDELSQRYIEPAMSVLVSGIDGDCIATATKGTYQLVGTAGTTVGTVSSGFSDTSALGQARAKINQQCAPQNGRILQVDSVTMASIANGVKHMFNPQQDIGKAWREGFVARTAMCDIYENERTWSHTVGADVTSVTLDTFTVTNGIEYINMTAGATLTIGTVFTIAGVYDVHPETKQTYSHLKQFVCTGPGTSATSADISPPIYTSGPLQNVSATPATTAALTFVGAINTTYRQNIMYHPDAFAFVSADLPLYGDSDKCVRRTQDGLSLRVWQASDIINDQLLMRIDMLYGFKILRPEWACRITN